jgi:hypothetical protein
MHKYPKPKKKHRPTEEERAKARARAAARRKMSKVERMLEAVRNNPSPTCHDRKQLSLMDYMHEQTRLDHIKQQAFDNLDRAIGHALDN